jgi:hypothetical protein
MLKECQDLQIYHILLVEAGVVLGAVGVTTDTVVSFSATSTIVEAEVDSVSESPTVDCSVDVSCVVTVVLEMVVVISGNNT